MSFDPLAKDYPELTPYQFASNEPISNIDIDGLEAGGWELSSPLIRTKQNAQMHFDAARIKMQSKLSYFSISPERNKIQQYNHEKYRLRKYRELGYKDDGSESAWMKLAKNKTWNAFADNLAFPALNTLAIADGVYMLRGLGTLIETYTSARKISFLRDILGVKKTSNIGLLEGQVGNVKINDIAISGNSSTAGTVSMVNDSKRVFETFSVRGYDRVFDSEVKLLENFAETYKATPNIEGVLKLTSERQFCSSCTGVIEQFKKMFPKVKLEFINGVK